MKIMQRSTYRRFSVVFARYNGPRIFVCNAPVPLTILTSSDAYLIPKMRKFQRSDEFR